MKIIKKDINTEFVKKWMQNGINPILLSIIDRRGLTEEDNLVDLFLPLIENIISPFYFKDLLKSYKRLERALLKKEKIIIFGDIDVDGTTSTVIITDFLRELGLNAEWEVPEGDDYYGLNQKNILNWIGKYNLCITVDCGITNNEEITFLNDNKIDTIIIDHHQPLINRPEAFSIINPKNEDSFGFKDFAACGVSFLFIFGFIFYKSKYFNKKTAIIYQDGNELFIDIYVNMILIEKNKINDIEDSQINNIDYIFYHPENHEELKNNRNILKSIKKEFKIINPAIDLNNNDLLKLLTNKSLKAKIILFNSLFKSIKKIEYIIEKYLPLVMLGTIADVMPLIKTNRILTYIGFNQFKKGKLKNISLLCKKLDIDIGMITSKDISWSLCPLLNAPGRMSIASKTVNFLINDLCDIKKINELIFINDLRKQSGDKAYNIFIEELEKNKFASNKLINFFYSDEIHKGITGITATKLSKHTKCPTIVAAREGDYYVGSIRGDTEYHFVHFLEKSQDILTQFGGHKNAAGFRFHVNDLDLFKEFINKNSSLLIDNNIIENIFIDAEIPVRFLNYNLIKTLNILEPFGENNPNPVLFTPSIEILNYQKMGKTKQHLKLFFKTYNQPFTGIYWNKADKIQDILGDNKKYDVTYQLETNKFCGQFYIQMIILDLKISDNDND